MRGGVLRGGALREHMNVDLSPFLLAMRQAKLSFSARAKLPALRHHGAEVATSSSMIDIQDLPSTSTQNPNIRQTSKKRRDLSAGGIVASRKTHTMRETITKYPELCEKTVCRMMKERRKKACD